MIQFNLLPDVKLEFIKTQRLKRSVVTISVLAASASLFVLVTLFLAVVVFQKHHLNDLSKDIKTDSDKLQTTTDINKVLTIQNQLISLPKLHDAKPVTSRLYGYLKQVVPNKVTISQLNADFDKNTFSFTGSADSLATINKFVDTLKFTTYTTTDNTTATNAFTSVVLTSFGRTDKDATYVINLNFNHDIFDSSKTIKLTVPAIITTRSETEKPTDLFKAQTTDTSNQGTGQ